MATRADYSWVGPSNLFPNATTVPAKPGDVIILWGTGFGATNPAVPAGMIPSTAIAGKVGNLVKPPSVLIGGVTAIRIHPVSAILASAMRATLWVVCGMCVVGFFSVSPGFQSPSGVYINPTQ